MQRSDVISVKTFLWIELGLQSTNENTIKLINRGYTHKVFDDTIKKLQKRNIRLDYKYKKTI